MWNKPIRYILVTLTACLFFVSCGKNDPSVNASRLRVKLTDAGSFTIKELLIDIRAIDVLPVDTAGKEGEWVSLDYSGGTYDLLKLMNGRTVQLIDQYFPAGGKIGKLKLLFGNNSHIWTNTEKEFKLNIPQELLDGVVIDHVDAVLTPNIITTVVIDVNAALSVREENGNYYLRPEVRAFDETFGGSMRGYVTPVDAGPIVGIANDPDTFFTLPEGERGMFMFTGLKAGEWTISVFARPESGYQDTTFTDSIFLRKRTELKPIVLKLKPAPLSE